MINTKLIWIALKSLARHNLDPRWLISKSISLLEYERVKVSKVNFIEVIAPLKHETPNPMLTELIIRLKPDVVVETGVASGRSTASILIGMDSDNKGKLYSIDLPTKNTLLDGTQYNIDIKDIGYLVPEYCKSRWTLIIGDSKLKLESLLKELVSIDIFIHDSLHTEEHMMWEYETAWEYIKPGGLLLSHDISMAFRKFAKSVDRRYTCTDIGIKHTYWGGIVK